MKTSSISTPSYAYTSPVKQSFAATPRFEGKKSYKFYLPPVYYAPDVFEASKDKFEQASNNLLQALNNMKKGLFTLENKNWGSADKKVKQGEIWIKKDDSTPYLFLTSKTDRQPWYEPGAGKILAYRVTLDSCLAPDNPELTDEVKQKTQELTSLFDKQNIPQIGIE